MLFLNDAVAADRGNVGPERSGSDDRAADESAFRGGALTFYGLLGGPEAQGVGLPMLPRAGTLVAFRSEIVHGVEPVTAGERYTIVCWFY